MRRGFYKIGISTVTGNLSATPAEEFLRIAVLSKLITVDHRIIREVAAFCIYGRPEIFI
jgi:hypothetical protein